MRTNRWFGFVIIMILIFAWRGFLPATQGKVIVFYANGMFNTENDAEAARLELEKRIGTTLNGQPVEYKIAYNQNEGMISLVEVARQKSIDVWPNFFDWMSGRSDAPDWFWDAMKSLAVGVTKQTWFSDEDLQQHLWLYGTEIDAGNKVLIVGHSQGNFYANEACILGNDPNNLKMVSVATPADSVADDGHYTTLTDDAIIVTVRLVLGALPGNVTNSQSYGQNHNFVHAYMGGDASGLKIIADIKSVITELQNTPSALPTSLWTQVTSGTTDALLSVWGSSADNVFIVGNSNTILTCDRNSCILAQIDWSQIKILSSFSARAVWGTSATDVFVVGNGGVILHYDGNIWSVSQVFITTVLGYNTHTFYPEFRDVWGTSGSDVFALGLYGNIFHYDGVSWSLLVSFNKSPFYSIWGFSGDLVTIDQNGLLHEYNGVSWNYSTTNSFAGVYSLWSAPSEDLFAVSGSGVNQYDGLTWTRTLFSVNLRSVYGNTVGDVFAVGRAGTIYHSNNGQWAEMDSGVTDALLGVWCDSTGNVAYAVGSNGVILRYSK